MENLVKCLQLDIDRKKGFFYDFPFFLNRKPGRFSSMGERWGGGGEKKVKG